MSAYHSSKHNWVISPASEMDDTSRLHWKSQLKQPAPWQRTKFLYLFRHQTKPGHEILNEMLSSLMKPPRQSGFNYTTLLQFMKPPINHTATVSNFSSTRQLPRENSLLQPYIASAMPKKTSTENLLSRILLRCFRLFKVGIQIMSTTQCDKHTTIPASNNSLLQPKMAVLAFLFPPWPFVSPCGSCTPS